MQISINGNDKNFDLDTMSIITLIEHMNLVGKRIAIERNGVIVPRSQFDSVMLRHGDKLEIVGAVGGG